MTTAEAAPKTLQGELQSLEKGGTRQQVGGGGRHSVAPVEARVVSLEHPPHYAPALVSFAFPSPGAWLPCNHPPSPPHPVQTRAPSGARHP